MLETERDLQSHNAQKVSQTKRQGEKDKKRQLAEKRVGIISGKRSAWPQVGFTVGTYYTHAGMWVYSGSNVSFMARPLVCLVKSR